MHISLEKQEDCSTNAVKHESGVKAAILANFKETTSVEESTKNEDRQTQESPTKFETVPRFGREMAKVAVAAVKTSKPKFMEMFDYGVPDPNIASRGAEEVLILYSDKSAIPTSIQDTAMNEDGNGIPMLSAADATAQCKELNVVLNQAPCLAIMNHYNSFHIQRWMKVKQSNKLEHVGRGAKDNGGDNFSPPGLNEIEQHWDKLRQYLSSVQSIMKELKPITERIKIKNTIIVMVCNFGQSQLLMNFACSSKKRGLEMSNLLVFATDQETFDLAEGLGLTVYFDKMNFGDLPTRAASAYADATFTAMMYAKVVTVQLINMMGYDVLFQDVDMHWYKNPLEAFHEELSPLHDFDILFQDDGARSLRYAPYCANSGFYYVRHNPKTRYLFISLLLQSDQIIAHHSHQQILSTMLTEHASLYGLKVKVLDTMDFPGGVNYHRRKNFDMFKDIREGNVTPWIFHMSWTHNKDNKLLYMKQMGQWHLNKQCENKNFQEIKESQGDVTDLVPLCCSAEPLITCHYSDKPSVINCNDSPPIDKGGKPFWND
eukprot:CAMPEP_0195515512 /NCGR_PEP_ID=MMETSP0794_2-20130614/6554_1 /TAXON_ID=515487 /ORGANISM="Stephanopyxis turris, Strain CCMP 815" /LENGTH=544 /DNA_ID=CAMNT_0040643943 /DNA_START=219 /DNA_END=1853 /DNA_ORIENTATION=+